MFKKIIAGGIGLAALVLVITGCGSNNTGSSESDSSTKSESTSQTMSEDSKVMNSVGEIIGSYNSEDKTVVGATKPGEEVEFKIPAKDSSNEEYLHFAFMHAASGEKGWYFAPKSDEGIALSKTMLENDKTVDITDEIGLFAAPNETTSTAVTADDGMLKFGETNKFMTATVALKDDMYVVTIKNISEGDMETPFSSGVWELTNKMDKGFDHTASKELSTLATSGHRDDLYKKVQDDAK